MSLSNKPSGRTTSAHRLTYGRKSRDVLLAATSVAVLALSGCGWVADEIHGGGGGDTAAKSVADSDANVEGRSQDGRVPGVMPPAGPPPDLTDPPGGVPPPVASPAPAPSVPGAGKPGGSNPAPAPAPSPSPSPAPSPTPTPAPAPAPSAGTNSVDVVISDMSKLNDLTLKGVDLKYGFAKGPGYVIMGNDPRGTNTPDWYKSSYPYMVTNSYWNYLLPWFVHFEGEGNAATNTRIQMRNMKVYVKSRSSGKWTQVNKSQSVGGIICGQDSNYYHCPQSGEVRTESSGGVSSLPQRGYNFHGWWGSREHVNGPDIAAVMITLQARLVLHASNGVDDRSKARYLVQVGGDYYPSDASTDFVLPAIGISRAKLLTNDWQSISMTTLSDYGKQEPGGGITSAELRANPPPFD